MMVVEFPTEVITVPGHGSFVPFLDHNCTPEELITRVNEINSKYEVECSILAGEEIVGHICDPHDYVCLAAKLK